MDSSGTVVAPKVWCRQRWCRENPSAAHRLGDGCSCDRHGTAADAEPKPLLLKAGASRLAAFACRACGTNARRMVEGPVMFFRCETCAAGKRWPVFRSPGAGGR